VLTLGVEAAVPVALVAVALARAAVLLLLAGLVLEAAAAARFPPLLLPTYLGQVEHCLLPRLLLLQLLEPPLRTASSRRVSSTAPSASPNEFFHPPAVPCSVALHAGQLLLFTDGGAHSSNQSE